jgi:hypothetical protein
MLPRFKDFHTKRKMCGNRCRNGHSFDIGPPEKIFRRQAHFYPGVPLANLIKTTLLQVAADDILDIVRREEVPD